MKTNYIVKQQDIKDCGICCLESIIKYYNGYIPLETLRLDTKTNQNGTTAYNLIKTAKKYGFNACGKKINNIEDKDIILPAIAHIITENGLNHFIVIYKITEDYIYIMDPSKGYKKVPKETFKKEWTNIILIFKPYKEIPLYKQNNNIKKLFINILKQEKSLITKLLITNILFIILSILSSYHYEILISNKKHLISLTIILFISTFIKLYINHRRNKITIYLTNNIDNELIPKFIKHIINLPLNVTSSRTTGELITRVQDLSSIKNLFSEVLINIILDISLMLCSSIFLYSISSKLFLILFILSLLYIIIGISSTPILNEYINSNIDTYTEFNSFLGESIDSIESIKNLNITDKQSTKLDIKYKEYIFNTFNLNKILNLVGTLYNSINDIGIFIITSYGIYQYLNNTLSLISLITFNSLLSFYLSPLKDIISTIPKYNEIKLSYIKVQDFLSIEEEKINSIDKFNNGDIVFKNISYTYNDYTDIISNLNLTLNSKKHYLICGATGSGKSTLFKMLNHSIKDYKGNIYIDGINIKDYSLNTLRNNILYVSQKESLFTDTIYNNITLGTKVSLDKLNKILKLTKVDELINKKSLRLESILYDNGFNLSGGERQRIIIARSLILNPKILILDESLSEVDKTTEEYILNNLNKYYKKTTIIYITHTSTKVFNSIININNYNRINNNII